MYFICTYIFLKYLCRLFKHFMCVAHTHVISIYVDIDKCVYLIYRNKLSIHIRVSGSPRVPYWVVDTDYDTYSLIWSCTEYINLIQADFAWIVSRQRTLDETIVRKLQDKLASFGVNVSSFRKTVQENCTN